MAITSRDVWSALPYSARFALLTSDFPVSADSPWTAERVQVTPWSLLPQHAKEWVRDSLAGEAGTVME
jgi:hypothetical protein